MANPVPKTVILIAWKKNGSIRKVINGGGVAKK